MMKAEEVTKPEEARTTAVVAMAAVVVAVMATAAMAAVVKVVMAAIVAGLAAAFAAAFAVAFAVGVGVRVVELVTAEEAWGLGWVAEELGWGWPVEAKVWVVWVVQGGRGVGDSEC